MLRNNTFLPIVPQTVEGAEVKFITYEAANESLAGMGFYDANKFRIASKTIQISPDKDLNEENILAAANVILAANASAPVSTPAQAKS